MEPTDADAYFCCALRSVALWTRVGRASVPTLYVDALKLRYRAEIYNLTGRPVECPLDEVNRPRRSVEPRLSIRRPRSRSSNCCQWCAAAERVR
ncbi:hypothetical protein [Actinokineospora sp. NBRC 105648]|uniref:hypothetical protein n=1 Tax=Actinokineospora sp. NBRC 105648 TaxID=3032206 RepID=UPI002553E66B|nr:hypothetical protein [Actinokineospora sp. NBRC 105648]